MTGLLGLWSGTSVFCVGVEEDPDDPALTRVYINHRAEWRYFLLDGADAETMRKAWSGHHGHVIIPTPAADDVHQDVVRMEEARELADDEWHRRTVTPCEGGAHPVSRRTGPGRWTCSTCGIEWYGPNY